MSSMNSKHLIPLLESIIKKNTSNPEDHIKVNYSVEIETTLATNTKKVLILKNLVMQDNSFLNSFKVGNIEIKSNYNSINSCYLNNDSKILQLDKFLSIKLEKLNGRQHEKRKYRNQCI